MKNENGMLSQLKQRENELQELLIALQAQANKQEQNSPDRENETAEIQKVEAELKETQSKIEKVKEQSVEGKIETGVEITELVVEKVAGHSGYEAVVDPVVGGLATGVVVEGINIIRNYEATEAYIKGAVNEKIETVKEFIDEKFSQKEALNEEMVNAIIEKEPTQESTIDEKKELRTEFDKEYNDMSKRHEKEFKELSEKQYTEIKGTGTQTPEMAAKFQEQQKELREKQMKEFGDIENREYNAKADLALNQWEQDIKKKENDINEKFDKKLEDTMNMVQKQADQIEKHLYDGKDKEEKMNDLKEIANKEKNNIEEKRINELKNIEERKDNLEQVKEATNILEAKERLAEIERQRELEERANNERER